MYLHEFQAKQLLSEYGVPVAPFHVVSSLDELDALGLKQAVLKIQVHAGGRGKAGGIVRADTPKEIRKEAQRLFGMRFVNAQTGPEGVVVEKLLLDTPVTYEREYYLAVYLDRSRQGPCVIASTDGGSDIEEQGPDKLIIEKIPEGGKLYDFQQRRLAVFLGWNRPEIINSLVKLFFDFDALLVEINPLVVTAEGGFIALDAKINIDDNALFRQKRLMSMWDPHQVPQAERRAKQHDLAYVALSGDIGCMVNGAGLAMATMDLIRFWGGEPANFLDVGGGSSEEKIIEGFSILFSEPNVKAILVNIFGGIMNCETIAKALVRSVRDAKYKAPIVVRMEGTNWEKARQDLQESGLDITFAAGLDEACRTVVEKRQPCLS
ncbi:MAG: ADP-forming succinate--CoA ligase subunit beta [Verrucomicrobia bacterium]|nr:ADP-forming succinate--CoA ligase subunit beta [Verrucomicrobiota bacterium]